MEESNIKAMREALEKARRVLHCAIVAGILKGDDVNSAFNEVIAALSDTPRNCDVGTAAEQDKRHSKWCSPDICECTCTRCFAEWAQMPYEEGEAK